MKYFLIGPYVNIAIIGAIAIASLLIIFVLLICCIVNKNKKAKVKQVHNLARDSSIMAEESSFLPKRQPKPPINRPLPPVPDPNHSYYYPNIAQHNGKRIWGTSMLGYEHIAPNESASYYYLRITQEVMNEIAQDSAS